MLSKNSLIISSLSKPIMISTLLLLGCILSCFTAIFWWHEINFHCQINFLFAIAIFYLTFLSDFLKLSIILRRYGLIFWRCCQIGSFSFITFTDVLDTLTKDTWNFFLVFVFMKKLQNFAFGHRLQIFLHNYVD